MHERNEKYNNNNKKQKTIKQNKTQKTVILEAKDTKTELTNPLETFKNRPDHAEESVKSSREAKKKKVKSEESMDLQGSKMK